MASNEVGELTGKDREVFLAAATDILLYAQQRTGGGNNEPAVISCLMRAAASVVAASENTKLREEQALSVFTQTVHGLRVYFLMYDEESDGPQLTKQ